MLVHLIFLLSLTLQLQWIAVQQPQISNSKFTSKELRTFTKEYKVVAACSLGDSDKLQNFVQISDAQLRKIDSHREQLVENLQRRRTTVEELVSELDKYHESVSELLDEDQQQKLDMAIVSSLLERLGKNELDWRLRKSVLVCAVRAEPEVFQDIVARTNSALDEMNQFVRDANREALDRVLSELTEAQRKAFQEIVGKIDGSFIQNAPRFDSLEETFTYVMAEISEALIDDMDEVFVGELELIDSQRREIEQLLDLNADTPRAHLINEYSELDDMLHNNTIEPSQLEREELKARMQVIVKTVHLDSVRKIREILLPHQVKQFRHVAARTFVSQRDSRFVAWPIVLQKELDLTGEQLKKLADKPGLIESDRDTKIKGKAKEIEQQLKNSLPMELMVFVDEIPDFSERPFVTVNRRSMHKLINARN